MAVASAAARIQTPAANDKYEAILTAAKRAKVAAGTIYTYFPSKEALVNALYRKWKTAVGQQVFTRYPFDAAPREQFDAMWTTMVEFALANREAFVFLELHHHVSYLDKESRELEGQLKDFGIGAIARGQGLGVLKEMDTVLLMELLFGAFVGMMRSHWEGRVKLTPASQERARVACWDMMAKGS
jgi:AcrR family transcriptional regulator